MFVFASTELILVLTERRVACRWSTQIRREVLQRIHFHGPALYPRRHSHFREVLSRSVLANGHFCEKRASLGSDAGALQVLSPIYPQSLLFAESLRARLCRAARVKRVEIRRLLCFCRRELRRNELW